MSREHYDSNLYREINYTNYKYIFTKERGHLFYIGLCFYICLSWKARTSLWLWWANTWLTQDYKHKGHIGHSWPCSCFELHSYFPTLRFALPQKQSEASRQMHIRYVCMFSIHEGQGRSHDNPQVWKLSVMSPVLWFQHTSCFSHLFCNLLQSLYT